MSETVPFTGRTVDLVVSRPTAITPVALTDMGQSWKPGQWKNYMVKVASSPTARVRITGNDENTLFGSFPSGPAWRYSIYRDLANSYHHWKRVERITTTDLDVDFLTVSVSHSFDTPGAHGKLYSFTPHTDGRDDMYRKNRELGRYTFEVEAVRPRTLDNFLNVICSRDPGGRRPTTHCLHGEGVAGVLVDRRFALFAEDGGELASIFAAACIRGFFL